MVIIQKKCCKCGEDFLTGGLGQQSTCEFCSEPVAWVGIIQPDGTIKGVRIDRSERRERTTSNINDEENVVDRLGA